MIALSVSRLLDLAPILETPPWSAPVCADDVWEAYFTKTWHQAPLGAEGTSAAHAARIAWLMHTGWDDPILVDVGVPGFPGHQETWLVQDGNHRFYAAVLRDDTTILANIDGCLNTANTLFGLHL